MVQELAASQIPLFKAGYLNTLRQPTLKKFTIEVLLMYINYTMNQTCLPLELTAFLYLSSRKIYFK